MSVLICNFCGIIVVFLSNLEYNAKPPFSSHVLYWFLRTWVSTQQNIHGMIILPGNPHQLIKSFLNNEQFISFIQ